MANRVPTLPIFIDAAAAVNVLYRCNIGQCNPAGKQCMVMMIKYDIQHLSNAQGEGISCPCMLLARQHLSPPAEREEIAERNTTLRGGGGG